MTDQTPQVRLERAKDASRAIAALTSDDKSRALEAIAVALESNAAPIIAANAGDIDRGRADGIGESLIEGLLPQLGPDARILMPRSADARPYVAERLAKAAQVTEIGIYRTVPDSGDDDVLRKLAV